MVKLEDKSYEKISGLLKDYFENPDFELNYLINESTIVFFINLSVSKELSNTDTSLTLIPAMLKKPLQTGKSN